MPGKMSKAQVLPEPVCRADVCVCGALPTPGPAGVGALSPCGAGRAVRGQALSASSAAAAAGPAPSRRAQAAERRPHAAGWAAGPAPSPPSRRRRAPLRPGPPPPPPPARCRPALRLAPSLPPCRPGGSRRGPFNSPAPLPRPAAPASIFQRIRHLEAAAGAARTRPRPGHGRQHVPGRR